MMSYTITEEPIQPVMFRRLHQEAQTVNEPGPDVIVFIENRKRVLVRDSPSYIQGIADLLTLQGVQYKTFKNDQIENIENLFTGLESSYSGWYDWHCTCSLHGRTTEKNFECHQGQTIVTPSDPEVS
jgi:hypothetical protein